MIDDCFIVDRLAEFIVGLIDQLIDFYIDLLGRDDLYKQFSDFQIQCSRQLWNVKKKSLLFRWPQIEKTET